MCFLKIQEQLRKKKGSPFNLESLLIAGSQHKNDFRNYSKSLHSMFVAVHCEEFVLLFRWLLSLLLGSDILFHFHRSFALPIFNNEANLRAWFCTASRQINIWFRKFYCYYYYYYYHLNQPRSLRKAKLKLISDSFCSVGRFKIFFQMHIYKREESSWTAGTKFATIAH